MTAQRCKDQRGRFFDSHFDINKDGQVTMAEMIDRAKKSRYASRLPPNYEDLVKQHWAKYVKY